MFHQPGCPGARWGSTWQRISVPVRSRRGKSLRMTATTVTWSTPSNRLRRTRSRLCARKVADYLGGNVYESAQCLVWSVAYCKVEKRPPRFIRIGCELGWPARYDKGCFSWMVGCGDVSKELTAGGVMFSASEMIFGIFWWFAFKWPPFSCNTKYKCIN